MSTAVFEKDDEPQTDATAALELSTEAQLLSTQTYLSLAKQIVKEGVSQGDVVSLESSFEAINIQSEMPLAGFTTQRSRINRSFAVEGVLQGLISQLSSQRDSQFDSIKNQFDSVRQVIKDCRKMRFRALDVKDHETFVESFYKEFGNGFDEFLQTHDFTAKWTVSAENTISGLTDRFVAFSKSLDGSLSQIDKEMSQAARKGQNPLDVLAKHTGNIQMAVHPLYILTEPYDFEIVKKPAQNETVTAQQINLQDMKAPAYMDWLDDQVKAMNELLKAERTEKPDPINKDVLQDIPSSDDIDLFYVHLMDKMDQFLESVRPFFNGLLQHSGFVKEFSANMGADTFEHMQNALGDYIRTYSKMGDLIGYVATSVVDVIKLSVQTINTLDGMKVACSELSE